MNISEILLNTQLTRKENVLLSKFWRFHSGGFFFTKRKRKRAQLFLPKRSLKKAKKIWDIHRDIKQRALISRRMVCALKRVKMKYTQRTIEAIWVLMLFSHVLRFFRLFLLSMFLFLNLRKKWKKNWEEGDKAQLWTLETFFSSCNTDPFFEVSPLHVWCFITLPVELVRKSHKLKQHI